MPKPAKAKYKRISDQLLNQIEQGHWRPGDRLPSEEQLAENLMLSLGTVQRALRNLAEMGVIERRHGAGTFVSGARAPEQHLRHFRFKAEGGTELLPVYFKVLDVVLSSDHGPWSGFFGNDEKQTVRINRLVSVNEEFGIFSEVVLPASRFAGIVSLGASCLDGISIRDMLVERFNAPTLSADQAMLCQALPPRVTRLINVPSGQYGLVWTICGKTYRDAPITWQRVFVPPSDRSIEILSKPGPAAVK